jgi:hypothetical protein
MKVTCGWLIQYSNFNAKRRRIDPFTTSFSLSTMRNLLTAVVVLAAGCHAWQAAPMPFRRIPQPTRASAAILALSSASGASLPEEPEADDAASQHHGLFFVLRLLLAGEITPGDWKERTEIRAFLESSLDKLEEKLNEEDESSVKMSEGDWKLALELERAKTRYAEERNEAGIGVGLESLKSVLEDLQSINPTMESAAAQVDGMKQAGDEIWEKGFSLLLRYKLEHGQFGVPLDLVEDEFRLGTWVDHQRKFWKKGKLDEDKVERLANIGFEFDPVFSGDDLDTKKRDIEDLFNLPPAKGASDDELDSKDVDIK